MLVQVAADHTRIGIVTAPGGNPDNDAHGLTLCKTLQLAESKFPLRDKFPVLV
jgi:hypothetical protein